MAKLKTPEPNLFNNNDIFKGDDITKICESLNCPCNTPGWPDRYGEALYNYTMNNGFRRIRTLSLFSGAGGLDIGFHDLGFNIVQTVEIEEKFSATLDLNSGEGKKFEGTKNNCIDIREFTGDDLGTIDFIIGGPPCQTFSSAGRRGGGVLGTTDPRGVLFREYVRLLKKLNPVGFLFENVYGIVGAQGGEAWREIQKSFSEVGYRLFSRVIDAADYGTPQHRERLIIVGLRQGVFKFPRPTHGPDSLNNQPFYNAGTAVSGLKLTTEEKKTGIGGRYGSLLPAIPPGLNYSFYTSEMGHPNPIFAWRSKFSDFMYKADPEVPVRTIKAQGGQYTGPLHWDSRYFSYSEFKRLQTFPDDYQISGNKQVAVHQIGNSVPPQLARTLALAIRIQVFGDEFPFQMSLLDDYEELTFRKRKGDLTAHYREKARQAIAGIQSQAKEIISSSHSFYLTIGERFKYIENENEGDYSVRVEWGDFLNVTVTPKNSKSKIPIRIVVTPKREWTLPISHIEMAIYSSSWMAVTAAWKVVDRELIIHKLKADLVQLNGYYQYESQIVCQMTCGRVANSKIIKTIYSGTITGRNITTEELAKAWGVKEDEVLAKSQFLRGLGYEVRNSKTNPQLDDNVWILPYKFPTLLPESVQLSKSLI